MAKKNVHFQDPAAVLQTLMWDLAATGTVVCTEAVILGGSIPGMHVSNGIDSIICGRQGNFIVDARSSILGGRGNTVTYDFAAVFGNGIASVANEHLHINNLWLAPATYNVFAGVAPPFTFQLGTVYVDTAANGTLRIQV